MYHKQLVKHVEDGLKAGRTDSQIREDLLKDGWTKADIDQAFFYQKHPEKLRRLTLTRFFHMEMPVVASIALVALVALAVGSLVFLLLLKKQTLSYSVERTDIEDSQKVVLSYGEQPALSNPDVFKQVKQKFVDEQVSFIEADLSSMKLRVYKDGEMFFEVPIDTKGKTGSWWETPAGLYKVNSKEETHFSTMGHVWMPWSLNFQGNFYIHGHTYYPGGQPTSSSFTGGCIRLSTENAEKVYQAVDVDMPILVYEKSFSSDNFVYTKKIPPISAPKYLVADLLSNHVFLDKLTDELAPIASLTKLMTAVVATEYINLDKVVTVPDEAIIPTSKPRLTAGMQISVYQLLFPLLTESSNEAAETIARAYGRKSYVKHMNDKAASIGMSHTKFGDPSGVSEENTSTLGDLFMLAKYIYNNRSFVFNITSNKVRNSAYGVSNFADLGNFNDFYLNPYFVGGKNGKTTAASETGLYVFDLPVGTTTRPIVIIVLGSQNQKDDVRQLLDYVLDEIK